MSKSILVIDTPENCNECQFSAERLCGNGRCTLNKDCRNVIPKTEKPNWCPLKELPQEINENETYTDCEYYRAQGYNDCIDEILKGAE